MKKIAIIGGGAAGMIAAYFAADSQNEVTIYESNKELGKKILASGNGRCNIINTVSRPEDYASENSQFVSFALKHFPFKEFEKFALSIGILLEIKEDGRCYPLSNEAKSVQQSFKTALAMKGITIHESTPIEALKPLEKGFQLHSGGHKFYADAVLIASGSEAAPQLGATSIGYQLAKSLKHPVLPTYPSLVQLELDSPYHFKMAGTKTIAEVSLFIDKQMKAKLQGDILFANYGISGLAILDISQKASKALMEKKTVSIGLNLVPEFTIEKLENLFKNFQRNVPNYPIEIVLSNIIPSKIARILLESLQIPSSELIHNFSPKEIKKLIFGLRDWRFSVSGTHGFKHAEVSGGGVDTTLVNPNTMESKLIKGLFFAGEVLDVVGKRGGYNFHFAWASGMIAGKEMKKNI